MSATANFLEHLTGDLSSIRELAARLSDSSQRLTQSGVYLSHRPAVAPEAYALCLYRPLPVEALDRYLVRTKLNVPSTYLEVLRRLNGMHAFQLALFGVPLGLTYEPPTVDRSELQPYDLATANERWKREFQAADGLFHFGGGPFSDDENVGYFLASTGTVHSLLKSGEEVGTWPSVSEFLPVELARAEAEYSHFEAFMSSLQKASRSQSKTRGDA